ncbi:hypothetical protein QS306_09160 [Paraburkholderia bonniea]|uniref:hypothetical protein n=1 Tax=Paraburkholderia bonniea TaxID=2152891 RepID=UPI002574123F|nr:hypothetical protein [Paraburkholderia bonniea]WJF89291.1 hypothetical protein QS306_09160 [Paraburkholderia bonniea]WJF92607.1 hypothetical protein QS308_09170 [Paraburkholderia bonniea]
MASMTQNSINTFASKHLTDVPELKAPAHTARPHHALHGAALIAAQANDALDDQALLNPAVLNATIDQEQLGTPSPATLTSPALAGDRVRYSNSGMQLRQIMQDLGALEEEMQDVQAKRMMAQELATQQAVAANNDKADDLVKAAKDDLISGCVNGAMGITSSLVSLGFCVGQSSAANEAKNSMEPAEVAEPANSLNAPLNELATPVNSLSGTTPAVDIAGTPENSTQTIENISENISANSQTQQTQQAQQTHELASNPLTAEQQSANGNQSTGSPMDGADEMQLSNGDLVLSGDEVLDQVLNLNEEPTPPSSHTEEETSETSVLADSKVEVDVEVNLDKPSDEQDISALPQQQTSSEVTDSGKNPAPAQGLKRKGADLLDPQAASAKLKREQAFSAATTKAQLLSSYGSAIASALSGSGSVGGAIYDSQAKAEQSSAQRTDSMKTQADFEASREATLGQQARDTVNTLFQVEGQLIDSLGKLGSISGHA